MADDRVNRMITGIPAAGNTVESVATAVDAIKAALVTTAKDCRIDVVDVADMALAPVHDAIPAAATAAACAPSPA